MRQSSWSLITATFAVLTVTVVAPATAKTYRYCAWYFDGSSNCGFSTMSSCRASVSGVGGSCGINPRVGWRTRTRGYQGQPYGGWTPRN